MLSNFKIRTKLIAILFPVVVALVLLAGIGASQRRTTANRSHRDTQVIELAAAQATVADDLEMEGILTVQFLAGGDTKAAMMKQRGQTDASVKALLGQYDTFGKQLKDTTSQQTLSQVPQRLGALSAQRSQIDAQGQTWNAARGFYDGIAGSLIEANKNLVVETSTPEVVSSLQSFHALSVYKRQVANSGMFVSGYTIQGRWYTPSAAGGGNIPVVQAIGNEFGNFTTAKSDEAVKKDVLDSTADATLQQAVRLVSGSDLIEINSLTQGLTSLAAGAPTEEANALPEFITAKASTVGPSVASAVQKYRGVETDFADILKAKTSRLQHNAQRAAQLFILTAFLMVFLAIALAWVVARSITRPVKRLTTAAHKLSREQLPRLVDSLKNPAEDDVGYLANSFTPIDVSGRDEIGQLAEAFNGIQSVAVNVATEQASLLRKGIGDMFINLARRNQTLLDRQIEFIDQLESKEEDPDQLENLFRLDHLATRMRRNAESLLVLAGAEPNRRRGKPVPLADVVRAAVGEVEDFARIDMLQFDEVLVASNAALDIAHLLSELMENAANFSPPDTRVEVVGHRTKAEGYVISIADHGIGMTAEQLTDSNDLLARPPLVGLALSRSLGFIVVGRLATRFGVAVRLMPSPSGGTTAMITLPSTLITDQPKTGPGSITAGVGGELAAPDDLSSMPEARTAPERPAPVKPDVASLVADAKAAENAPPATRRRPPSGTGGRSSAKPGGQPPVSGARAGRAPQTSPKAPAEAPAPATASNGGAAALSSNAGLKKRVPRAAGGERAIPGGESNRSATTTRRSPEEVRSMLSNYRSGIQRGKQSDEAKETPEGTEA